LDSSCGIVSGGKEGPHVADEPPGDLGRQFYGLSGHGPKIGVQAAICESKKATL
jgi:hypothetical protein